GANRVLRRSHAKKQLHATRVFLCKPASQTIPRRWFATLQGLEQGDGRWKGVRRQPLVKRKTPCNQPLPNQKGETQQCQATKNAIQNHRVFVIRIRSPPQADSAKGSVLSIDNS